MTTPSPSNDVPVECSDEPKLTAEEWEAVAYLAAQPEQDEDDS